MSTGQGTGAYGVPLVLEGLERWTPHRKEGNNAGSRCNGQCRIIRNDSLFFARDLELMLGFPVVEATVVLPSLGGLSQGRSCTGLERSWAQPEHLWVLPE